MARPRLVEEGVPIGSTLGLYGHQCEDDDDDDDDEAMMELDHDITTGTGGGRQQHHHDELLADEAKPPIDSSLMRAVGGKIRIKPKPRRTTNRTVIGGDTTAAGEDPVDSYHDHHHQLFPSWPSSATQPPHHSYHDPYHHSWTQQQQQHQERPAGEPAEIPAPYRHAPLPATHHRPPPRRIVIGQPADDDEPEDTSTIARMEGVEDHSLRQPLVVLDGANVAYGYNDDLLLVLPAGNTNGKGRPNVRGIIVAAEYWRNHHVRVLVVLPQPWLNNAPDMTLLLSRLPRSLFVAAPSRDDDDAYALQIAQRENSRARAKSSSSSGGGGGVEGPAYVVSNDMFRDAQERDGSGGQLAAWLNTDDAVLGKGRISYTFANLGRRDDHGDVELDYLPNPRHPLVIWAEQQQQQPHPP